MKIPVENIVELTVEHQFLQAYPIINQLHTDLTLEEYLELLNDMRKDGQQLFALYHDTSIVALAGISWHEDLYNERYVFVQDLVTDVNHRPSGLGYRSASVIYIIGQKNRVLNIFHWNLDFNVLIPINISKKFGYTILCFPFKVQFSGRASTY